MKAIKRMVTFVLAVFMVSVVATADEVKVEYNELPQKARRFLEKHFGKMPATKEVEVERNEYSVELKNGHELKFDEKGNLLEIDSPDRSNLDRALVTDILPEKAVEYLKEKDVFGKVDEITILRNGDYVVDIDRIANDFIIRFDVKGTVKNKAK